jgi:hypothetical protein
MSETTYGAKSIALLFVDPYNDCLSEGGKVWLFIKDIEEEVGLLATRPPRVTRRSSATP